MNWFIRKTDTGGSDRSSAGRGAIEGAERTVRLYPLLVFFLNCHFWAPVFFLYFQGYCTVAQIFVLEAIYYCSVSLFEVPSGYLADRYGRKWVLILAISALAWGSLFFFQGSGFWHFSLGQLFMAAGFAALSGTDTSLHYEALKELGRAGEYTRREARAAGLMLSAGALSATIGGIAGIFSLKLVYLFTLFSLCCALACAFLMEEPARAGRGGEAASFPLQLRLLVQRAFGWELRPLLLYSVFMTILVHIPYELYQPYLRGLDIGLVRSDSLFTGLHLAVAMLVGAWSTRYITRLAGRYGAWPLLFFLALFLVVLIGLMALFSQLLVAGLLLLRVVPKAMSTPVVYGLLAPRLPDCQRSSYLSLQSLLGRLSYGAVLLLMTVIAAVASDPVRGALIGGAILGAVLLLWLWLEKSGSRGAQWELPLSSLEEPPSR
ncbi:MFS transporter [Desulfogranum mediterraneum]|uniref:MFS transporter n=1 Tax=Desulfogranum mediterraneum TaxID=160661 RepID=UPI0004220812|nr:MFS transporter [Desulfogranum mediterraneum]